MNRKRIKLHAQFDENKQQNFLVRMQEIPNQNL
jgi:hypothetical protein